MSTDDCLGVSTGMVCDCSCWAGAGSAGIGIKSLDASILYLVNDQSIRIPSW